MYTNELRKKYAKTIPGNLKRIRKSLRTCTPQERGALKEEEKLMLSMQEGMKKKSRKSLMNSCKSLHCNPGCKNTLLEPGKTISKGYLQRVKMSQRTKKFMIEQRKNRFGDKLNVLKNDFSDKLDPYQVNDLKKRGAISACTDFYMPRLMTDEKDAK